MGRSSVGPVVLALVCGGCAAAAPGPASPARGGDAPPTIAERVDGALRQAVDEGTHWHRADALVHLGAEAVPLLGSAVLDRDRELPARLIAAQALGRIGGAGPAAALRSVAGDGAAPEELRAAAEDALFLLGDRGPVERRIASFRARHADIPIARAGAEARIARTLYATGRFREAADAWRALVREEGKDERRGRLAYDWACCAALAGAEEEALEAVAVSVQAQGTDLDWMGRDGDLRSLRGNPRFQRLLAEARAASGATSPARSRLQGLPGHEEYAALRHGYWEVAFERWLQAQNRYWEGFEPWLAANGGSRSEETAAEYRRLHGAEPEKPTREWVERFRALLAQHREDAIGAEIRTTLLTIFMNEDMTSDWIALYREAMDTPGQEEVVGENARSGVFVAWRANGKSDLDPRLRAWLTAWRADGKTDLEPRLRAWLAAHPGGVPAARVRLALAEGTLGNGDPASARAAYQEVVRLHPGTPEAGEATGALYELDHLAVGMPAPEFEAKDIRGAPVSLGALRGRVVLLDFWATWCGPCLGEVPGVIALQERLGESGFALVGVSLDADGLALADFLEHRGMAWTQVCDLCEFEGQLPRLYHVRGIPDTVLIDRDGRIVARGLRGDDLARAIEKALAASR